MAPAADDGLKKLEYLSLVSKICTELESHVGCGDKVLAEFITELGRRSETVEEFDAKLKENGAEMPDYFVRTLLTIIHAIVPPKPKAAKPASDQNQGKQKSSAFPALSHPDDLERAKELRREIERDAEMRAASEGRSRDDHRDRDRGQDWDRDRDRRRDRDREYRRDRDRDRDWDRHNRDRSHRRDRDRDRYDNSRAYDEEEEDGRDGRSPNPSNRRYADEPELYKVYRGRVSRVMDTGCFIQLNDFRGKEGEGGSSPCFPDYK